MITISYDFKGRKASDLMQINRILSTMSLESLTIEDFDGYLETTKDGDGNITHLRYGLDSGTLVCKRARGRKGHSYLIETVVVDSSAGLDHDEYIDYWREANPKRVIRTVITVGFDNYLAYTIIHHEK